MTHLADRLSYFQESVIREMTRKAIEYDAINLSQGMPDYSPPEELTEGITEAIKNSEHQYTVTYGRNDLREKIASKYETYNKIQYDPEDEITITCGASEAIACSILSLLNPSDEIIVLEPWYENYVPITYLANGKPVFVKLSEKDFGIDEENFKNKISEKTKAVIINTPHNPSGRVFSKEELNFLSDICNDNNLITITDEIYEYIIYDDAVHISPASLNNMFERTITISGYSKTFSITGWRVGYVATEKELMTGIRKVHDYLTICAPSIMQFAALKAYNLQEDYFESLKNRYQKNRDEIVKGLRKLGFGVMKPKGAYYLLADISSFGMNDLEFADFLVKDKGVATVPDSSFYETKGRKESDGSKYIRFSFSHKLETIKDALLRIEKRLNDI